MKKNHRLILLLSFISLVGGWAYFHRSDESLFWLLFVLVIGVVTYFKSNGDTQNKETDPYKASYEVEGFYDDFSKVGSGYPMKKNQKIPCCGGSIVEGDTGCCVNKCKKDDDN